MLVEYFESTTTTSTEAPKCLETWKSWIQLKRDGETLNSFLCEAFWVLGPSLYSDQQPRYGVHLYIWTGACFIVFDQSKVTQFKNDSCGDQMCELWAMITRCLVNWKRAVFFFAKLKSTSLNTLRRVQKEIVEKFCVDWPC